MRSQVVKQKAAADVLEKEVKARRLEVKSLELQLRNSKKQDESDSSKELDTLRAQLVRSWYVVVVDLRWHNFLWCTVYISDVQ